MLEQKVKRKKARERERERERETETDRLNELSLEAGKGEKCAGRRERGARAPGT